MSQSRARTRRRMRRIKRPRNAREQDYTFAKEAIWCTTAAAVLVFGIVAYVVWSFHTKGYAHIYMSILLMALLMMIVAAMFVNLWWRMVQISGRTQVGRSDLHHRCDSRLSAVNQIAAPRALEYESTSEDACSH